MYNLELAAEYWGKRLALANDKIEAVAGLSRPSYINAGYTNWEKDIIQTTISKYSPASVMDLGCGVGRLISPLLEMNTIKKIYAVDLTMEMLQLAHQEISSNNMENKDIELICSSSSSINLPEGSLDFIMCMGILEHLPLELQLNTLSELSRLLKKGGVMLLEINNMESIFLENCDDNTFRKSKQLDNGYFCGLIDKIEIKKHLVLLDLEIITTYSNPFFSVVSHLLREINKAGINEELGMKWMNIANKLDMGNIKNISDTVSDQIIIEIKKLQ